MRRDGPDYVILVRMREPEMMRSVRRKAERDEVSVAETIRTLIQWGLEAEEGK